MICYFLFVGTNYLAIHLYLYRIQMIYYHFGEKKGRPVYPVQSISDRKSKYFKSISSFLNIFFNEVTLFTSFLVNSFKTFTENMKVFYDSLLIYYSTTPLYSLMILGQPFTPTFLSF